MTQAFNRDCIEAMREFPDKHFELAIVDPPYGLGRSGKPKSTSSHGGHKGFEDKNWDKDTPDWWYFFQLQRVSKNQIIWGANYMTTKILKDSSCWIVWDKGQRLDQA